MYSSGALSTFSLLCNHHHHLFTELFHLLQLKLSLLNSNCILSIPQPPQSLATSLILFVFMNLTTLETSYNICLFGLAYFTYHNVFKVHLCCSMGQHILFMAEQYSMICIYHILFIHSFFDVYLGCFHLLAIVSYLF